ncbi:MAG TPA: hypothetical protein VFZ61_11135, partial [Polyangiales bacterium]
MEPSGHGGHDAPTRAEDAAPDAAADAGVPGPTSPGQGVTQSSFPDDCDRVFAARAHSGQQPDDDTPFVAPDGDHIETFWFVPSWTTKMHVTYVAPIVDNVNVVNEFRVYMQAQGVD